MSIVGFDPSITHFGWVIMNESVKGESSLISHGTFKTDTGDGLLVQRLIRQRERVKKLLVSNDIKFVAMEAPYFMDFSTELLFALNQYIHEIFLNLNLYVIYIQPQTLKKMSVKGVSSKEIGKSHMVHQAKTELGLHGKRFSEHVADAYFAAKVGVRFYQWNFLKILSDADLSEDERDLFCGKHTFVKGIKKGTTEYTGLIYRENDQFFDYTKHQKKTTHIMDEVKNGE